MFRFALVKLSIVAAAFALAPSAASASTPPQCANIAVNPNTPFTGWQAISGQIYKGTTSLKTYMPQSSTKRTRVCLFGGNLLNLDLYLERSQVNMNDWGVVAHSITYNDVEWLEVDTPRSSNGQDLDLPHDRPRRRRSQPGPVQAHLARAVADWRRCVRFAGDAGITAVIPAGCPFRPPA
jgi:hypothetical protein